MSLYQKASLVQIPSGYKAADDKLYSVVPSNGNGDFTVTVDADATRVNKDGLIESVVADQARLNYDFTNPQDPHLLLEPTRIQLAEYTNAISSANGYVLTNGTLTTDSHTAPDGSNEASTFEATSANGQFQKVKIGSSGVEYTVSAYVKRKTGTGTVYLRAVENTNTAVTVTDEWTRVSLTVTSTSVNIRYGMALATSGDEIYVWGFQVEAGSYATSLIPNTSIGLVTRTQDSCLNGGTTGEFNDSEGVLFIESQALANDLSFRFISICDGTTDNRVLISYNTVSNQIRADVVVSGSTQASMNTSSYTITDNHKIAIKYKTNDFALWVDGTEVSTDTPGNTFPNGTLSEINFDNGNLGATYYYEGKLKQLIYFNEALSDSELQTLTS
jgi:hypothetical protein